MGLYLIKQELGSLPALSYTLLYVGFVVLVLGVLIRFSALLQIQKYLKSTTLNCRGLYAIVRHPSYLGLMMCFYGLGIRTANWISFFCSEFTCNGSGAL